MSQALSRLREKIIYEWNTNVKGINLCALVFKNVLTSKFLK